MTWVPNLTSNTHDLDELLDFSKSQFPYFKSKVVIIIPTLQGCCQACIFKLLGICRCSINACSLPLLKKKKKKKREQSCLKGGMLYM